MKVRYLFFNNQGYLRSGWRLLLFSTLVMLTTLFLYSIVQVVVRGILPGSSAESSDNFFRNYNFLIQAIIFLITSTLIGFWCTRVLEGLPPTILGWAFHKGWIHDLLIGSTIGIASVLLAVVINIAAGGFRIASINFSTSSLKTLFLSAFIFLLGAAAEEALTRGYPLQTLLRSLPSWIAFISTSLFFALMHLGNPNLKSPVIIFINTTMAGIWLAIAYFRTRNLWFPLGIHWAWNWMAGAICGLPVSGITELTRSPLLRINDYGPTWLTGGEYGIEAGISSSIAIVLSSIYIWKTKRIANRQIPVLSHPTSQD
jgi:uncharacterized protein